MIKFDENGQLDISLRGTLTIKGGTFTFIPDKEQPANKKGKKPKTKLVRPSMVPALTSGRMVMPPMDPVRNWFPTAGTRPWWQQMPERSMYEDFIVKLHALSLDFNELRHLKIIKGILDALHIPDLPKYIAPQDRLFAFAQVLANANQRPIGKVVLGASTLQEIHFWLGRHLIGYAV
jgi:hypothetical protein